jgi:hypothetical protein
MLGGRARRQAEGSASMTITEHRLRRLFADHGFAVHEIHCRKHWVVSVARDGGGPRFHVAVPVTPSDRRYQHKFSQSLRKAEREAMQLHRQRAAPVKSKER